MSEILLLGDSLFQRAFSQEKDSTGQIIGSFGPRLTDAYTRRLTVVNCGFSGFNTRQILSNLTLSFWATHPGALRPNPRITIIFLGANDARLPDTPGGPQQHVPLEEYGKNLSMIVGKAKLDAKHVILITPPPVDERQTVEADSIRNPELKGVVRRRADVTKQYASLAAKVGREKNVGVLDLWSLIMEKASPKVDATERSKDLGSDEYLDEYGKEIAESKIPSAKTEDKSALPGSSEAAVNETLQSYLHDGLHFTRKGYDFLFDELMALIAETFPEQLPERIAFAAPAWDDEKAWKNLKVPPRDVWADERKFVLQLALGMGYAMASVSMYYVWTSESSHVISWLVVWAWLAVGGLTCMAFDVVNAMYKEDGEKEPKKQGVKASK